MSSTNMEQMVKKYLEKTNRPYSANDVFNNMNTNDNKLSKTAVTRALEELSANGKIKEKLNGKQKVYFVDQNNFDIDPNRVQQIDQQLEQLTQEFQEIEGQLKTKDSKLRSLKDGPTLEEVSQQLAQTNKDIKELENKLQVIQSKAQDFNPQLIDQIKTKRQQLVTVWKNRKRMANNMIDMILESYPKPKKALIEEMGIESDEQMKSNFPQI